ncbi:hypothetical protein [Kingella sp. (in: b-proteobacteria)]|nr:hypothetical protein [Kingella sp. (in: b-proteobacteria)]MDO4656616.1 hypothetical protein [Kingella sp. (in: b-proteobacteria)]
MERRWLVGKWLIEWAAVWGLPLCWRAADAPLLFQAAYDSGD